MKRDPITILEDLYKIDPKLVKKEQELKSAIEVLLASQPDTKFNQRYADFLRTRLIPPVDLFAKKEYETPHPKYFSYHALNQVFANFQISKWGYTVAGAIMAFLIILPFVDSRVETGFSIKQIVNSKSDGVFGTLTFNGAGKNATFKSPVAVEPQNSSTVAGSGVSAPTSPNTSVSLRTMAVNAPQGSTTSGVTGGVSGASIATTAPIQAATFVYTGQSLNLSESRSKVYVRVKGTEAGKQIATLLGNADFGIIDLKSFEGLQAKNVELTDGKDFGYSIAANFEDGSVNISPNWQKWIESGTSTSATSSVSSVLSVSDGQATTSVATSTPQIPIPESLHLPENSSSSSLDDVPTDQELIALSEAFLKEHGISTEIYNKPIVDRRAFDLVKTPVANGKLGSPQAISSRMPFEQPVSVIYPLTLSNAAIFDETGEPFGLQVSINLREKKVSGVGNLTSQIYDSSMYTLETDQDKIVDYINRTEGGVGGDATISLGTPSRVLMRYFNYETDGTVKEMYVPALKFPVEGSAYFQKNIVVPLVKEILDGNVSKVVPPAPAMGVVEPAVIAATSSDAKK